MLTGAGKTGHLAIASLAKSLQDLDLLAADRPALEVGDAWEIQRPSCNQKASQLGSIKP